MKASGKLRLIVYLLLAGYIYYMFNSKIKIDSSIHKSVSRDSAQNLKLENFIRRHQIKNCSIINESILDLRLKKGDVVKVNGSKLGLFYVSRTLTSTGELEKYCRKEMFLESIGQLKGEVFKNWPDVILKQNKNDIIERCFVIDGPANIRKEPKGEVVKSVNNFEVIKTMSKSGDWFLISKLVNSSDGNLYYPYSCTVSQKLEPIGWTHKNNLKFYPTPFISVTNENIKILNIKKEFKIPLPINFLATGFLDVKFFKSVKGNYLGGVLVHNGDDMLPSDAYFFNEVELTRVDYQGDFIKINENGLDRKSVV